MNFSLTNLNYQSSGGFRLTKLAYQTKLQAITSANFKQNQPKP
jgi:hypothetical protein